MVPLFRAYAMHPYLCKESQNTTVTCFFLRPLTYYRTTHWGWTHVGHPAGSFPCLHYGWRRMKGHAQVLQPGSPLLPSQPAGIVEAQSHPGSYWPQRQPGLGSVAASQMPCSHSIPTPPRTLGNQPSFRL